MLISDLEHSEIISLTDGLVGGLGGKVALNLTDGLLSLAIDNVEVYNQNLISPFTTIELTLDSPNSTVIVQQMPGNGTTTSTIVIGTGSNGGFAVGIGAAMGGIV